MTGAFPMERRLSASRDLIPYSTEARQVVLRHGNTVVVFDENSRQLSASRLRSAELSECPYCHRPYEPGPDPSPDDSFSQDDTNFVGPQYFRQLAASIAPTPSSSRPVSPTRRLAPLPPAPGASADSSVPGSSLSPEPVVPAGDANTGTGRISASAFSQGYFDRFFVTQRELGRGGRGVVLLVSHVLDRVDLGKFACKRIPVGDSHAWLEKVLLEVTLLQNISHENLVPYRHVWLEDFKPTAFGPSTPHVFILQQFCNSGTLLEYVLGPKTDAKSKTEQLKERVRRFSRPTEPDPQPQRPTPGLRFEEIFAFFKDITSGLAHLHANGYVHRDLKPQNCLLHSTSTGLRLLVSDFGEMQGADTPRHSSATGYTGTVSFSAPEVLGRDSTGTFGNFTDKSDVFSLGMIVFFMCFSRLPYSSADLEDENEDLAELKAEILDWQGLKDERRERADLPEKLYGFLKLLLSRNPSDRPSTDSILQAIRAESVFSEFGSTTPTSPLKERFESPDRYDDAPTTARQPPLEPASHLKRRSLASDKPHPRPHGSDKSRSRIGRSPELRPPASPRRVSEEPSGGSDVAVVGRRHAHDAPQWRNGMPMLLAPPHASSNARWRGAVRSRGFVRACKLALFMAKAWSLMAPCAPQFARPLVAYTLLGLAGVDLLEVVAGAWVSVVLAVVHLLVVYCARGLGVLCGTEL